MLHGGYRFSRDEIGRMTPGEIMDLIHYDRAYAHNQASLIAYHVRTGGRR